MTGPALASKVLVEQFGRCAEAGHGGVLGDAVVDAEVVQADTATASWSCSGK